jgi:hypothetical protein
MNSPMTWDVFVSSQATNYSARSGSSALLLVCLHDRDVLGA